MLDLDSQLPGITVGLDWKEIYRKPWQNEILDEIELLNG